MQEIQGWAVLVLDEVLREAAGTFPSGAPAVAEPQGLITPEAVATGVSVLAASRLCRASTA
jgi:hypothetical protein